MTLDLPVSARLCWWGTSWLRGASSPDELIEEVPGIAPLLVELAGWRRQGCQGLGLALPVEGDPLGLGGPAAFNAEALEVGEAVLALGPEQGLLVGAEGPWRLAVAARGRVPDLSEAGAALRSAMVQTTRRLAELDVARWRPEVADALMNLRRSTGPEHPLGVPAEAVSLAARAGQAREIVSLALAEDGAAISAGEIDRRRAALQELERTARAALVSACSADAWPPPEVRGR